MQRSRTIAFIICIFVSSLFLSCDKTAAKKKKSGKNNLGKSSGKVSAKKALNAVANNDLDAITRYMELDPDFFRLEDSKGRIPIHVAVIKGNKKALQLILSKNKNYPTSRPDFEGRNAIFHAARKGHMDMIPGLIKHGKGSTKGDMILHTLRDKKGLTIFSQTSKKDRTRLRKMLLPYMTLDLVIQLFSVADLDKFLKNKPKTLDDVYYPTFYKKKGDGYIKRFSLKEVPPLDIAAAMGSLKRVKVLMKHGAKAKGLAGGKALIVTCLYSGGRVASTLLSAGANVNTTNREGVTALHISAQKNNTKVIALLIKHKANVNAKTVKGLFKGATPYDYARKYRSKDAEQLIKRHGGKKYTP